MADSPSREDEQPGYLTDLELMPFDPEFRADPHPRLKRLREHCLVHRAAERIGHTSCVLRATSDKGKAVAYPISAAAYWFNQKVLDATVNAVGEGSKRTGDWVYDNIDQKIVDGAVNGSATVASETGHGLQSTQSGKLNQYGALIFGE